MPGFAGQAEKTLKRYPGADLYWIYRDWYRFADANFREFFISQKNCGIPQSPSVAEKTEVPSPGNESMALPKPH
jgi:hypothetical protein